MTKFFLLMICSLALVGCNFAPDNGKWSGSAIYTDSHGVAQSCDLLTVDISHYDDVFSLKEVSSTCGSRYWNWGPATFDVHGQSLYRDGKYMGEIQRDGGGSFWLEDPYQKIRVQVMWEIRGRKLFYKEDVFTTSGSYSLQGGLTKE